MQNKPLIVYLILQEMKHHQLINALENAGLQPDLHTISLLEVIQPLLGVPTPNDKQFPVITDELSELYNSWIEQAGNYRISMTSKHLKPLAEQCYQALVAQVHLQSRGCTA
jgi:hypothetical protein